eukprot:scaffold4049_cov204-Alexandrium_tamarense.AAC.30
MVETFLRKLWAQRRHLSSEAEVDTSSVPESRVYYSLDDTRRELLCHDDDCVVVCALLCFEEPKSDTPNVNRMFPPSPPRQLSPLVSHYRRRKQSSLFPAMIV